MSTSEVPTDTGYMALALNGAFLALSMIPLAIEFFPKPYKAKTTVRVGVGMAQESDLGNSLGGHEPSIALFDGNGNQLGAHHSKKTIKSGDFTDVVITHHVHSDNAPAEYISIISGGTEQICIAYLAITMASGDKNQFYGDVGKQCGGIWYPSNLLVETDEDPEFKPACIWLDTPDPGTGDVMAQAFSFHVPDFGSNQVRAMGYQDDPATMCDSRPRFHLWGSGALTSEKQCIPVFDPPLAYQSDGSDPEDTSLILVKGKVNCSPGPGIAMHPQINAPINSSQMLQTESNGAKHRSKFRRNYHACNDTSVVISEHIAHSAQEVCDSPTSMGPDFVSTKEGLHCDMCTHTLHEFCSSNVNSGCFDMSSHSLRSSNSTYGRTWNTIRGAHFQPRSVPAKSYDKIIHWT